MSALLAVEGLSVARGGALALERVSFALAEGEAMALLGANGAGKSTLLRALMGLEPCRGTISWEGRPLRDAPPELRARLGFAYVPEGRRVFPGLTVRENLEVAASGGGVARRREVERLLALFPPLAARRGVPAAMLSGGEQQLLALGRALLRRPRLLLLDEPSQGLAVASLATVLTLLAGLVRGGVALLVAEQNLGVARALARRALVLEAGRVARDGPITEPGAALQG